MVAFGRGTGFCDQISQLEQELGHSPAFVWHFPGQAMPFSCCSLGKSLTQNKFQWITSSFSSSASAWHRLEVARSWQVGSGHRALELEPAWAWTELWQSCGVCSQQLRSGPSVQGWLFKGPGSPWGAAECGIPRSPPGSLEHPEAQQVFSVQLW